MLPEIALAGIMLPKFDPVLIQIGPLAIRWYALAYVGGLLLGWRYMRYINSSSKMGLPQVVIDDYLVWATLGIILGGRVGYVLIYNLSYFMDNPLSIFAVWQGGMSFHGGLIGIIVSIILYTRKNRSNLMNLADLTACAVPIGLFFGRIANFINGELYGRTTDLSWGVIFPNGGPLPRHPSQLYEAALEGALLFAILWVMWRRKNCLMMPGLATSIFLSGYGMARCIVEIFRQPDIQIGFFIGGITMGQMLSFPMFCAGLILMWKLYLNLKKE